MGEGWELMKIRGIPLRVHPSWFVILLLFTWISQNQVSAAATSSLPAWISWGLGLITALLLFLSVLLHELGHSLVALREGVKVRSITLFFLGGVASVERECSTPMASLRVAAAGPLVSLVLAVSLLTGGVYAADHVNPLLANLVGQLGGLNLLLALFNLLPGLPLDGGLILKALVWQWTGSQRKGVQVATATGRALSLSAMVLGGWLLFFKGGGIGGLWLLMLGWFGFGASRSQTQLLALQKVLRELNAGQAAGRRFRVLEDDQSLRRLSQLRLSGSEEQSPQEWVLVCRSGRWVGYMTDQPLKELPVQQWDRQCLADHMKPISELPSIGEKAPLWQAVMALEQAEEGRLLVFNVAGLPCGTLDRIDLSEAVLKRLGVRLPAQFLETARRQNTYPLGMALPKVVESMVSGGLVEQPEASSSTS
ncbi:MAG: site-2 protease family protein [Cyanobacteriota bacterium]|nr:site-2 protease family protein [Cyanobacteriota bacterium]